MFNHEHGFVFFHKVKVFQGLSPQGEVVETFVGLFVRLLDGVLVGAFVRLLDGVLVGAFVGLLDGVLVGAFVGLLDGELGNRSAVEWHQPEQVSGQLSKASGSMLQYFFLTENFLMYDNHWQFLICPFFVLNSENLKSLQRHLFAQVSGQISPALENLSFLQ